MSAILLFGARARARANLDHVCACATNLVRTILTTIYLCSGVHRNHIRVCVCVRAIGSIVT